jgi:hypothetical protein
MTAKISKETFEQISRMYAEKLSNNRKSGFTYNYDGGVQQGIELTLNFVFGYEYNEHLDKDVSVSSRVKDRAEELPDDWERDDTALNGEYVFGNQRVRIERSWNPDAREMLFWNEFTEMFSYTGSKTIKNETVLDMISNKLLERYAEPEDVGIFAIDEVPA